MGWSLEPSQDQVTKQWLLIYCNESVLRGEDRVHCEGKNSL